MAESGGSKAVVPVERYGQTGLVVRGKVVSWKDVAMRVVWNGLTVGELGKEFGLSKAEVLGVLTYGPCRQAIEKGLNERGLYLMASKIANPLERLRRLEGLYEQAVADGDLKEARSMLAQAREEVMGRGVMEEMRRSGGSGGHGGPQIVVQISGYGEKSSAEVGEGRIYGSVVGEVVDAEEVVEDSGDGHTQAVGEGDGGGGSGDESGGTGE